MLDSHLLEFEAAAIKKKIPLSHLAKGYFNLAFYYRWRVYNEIRIPVPPNKSPKCRIWPLKLRYNETPMASYMAVVGP